MAEKLQRLCTVSGLYVDFEGDGCGGKNECRIVSLYKHICLLSHEVRHATFLITWPSEFA